MPLSVLSALPAGRTTYPLARGISAATLGALLTACPPTPVSDVQTDPIDDHIASTCEGIASAPLAGVQPCWDIGPEGRDVAERLKGLWGTEPAIVCAYYGYEGWWGSCGTLPEWNASYCPYDDAVAWDIDLLEYLHFQAGPFAARAFLAHEWGHLNQTHLYGPSASNKALELHADCQAGIFAAVEHSAGVIDASDVEDAEAMFCAIGDSYPSGWFDVGAHGRCGERRAAFRAGYDGAREELENVCWDDPLEAMSFICG